MAYVALHQLAPFPGPNPGDDAMYVLPNSVKGNDMAILGQYNAHDADASLHLGSGSTGSLPAANVLAGTFGTGAYRFQTVVNVGDVSHVSFIAPAAALLGSSTGNAEIRIGQADQRALIFLWLYNATPGSAKARIETYGGSNQINIQNNTGALLIGGAGGTLGFGGTAPVAKPTVTGSRGANAALASLLTALASYGLLTDSST